MAPVYGHIILPTRTFVCNLQVFVCPVTWVPKKVAKLPWNCAGFLPLAPSLKQSYKNHLMAKLIMFSPYFFRTSSNELGALQF